MQYLVVEIFGVDSVDHTFKDLDEAAIFMTKKSNLAHKMGWMLRFTVFQVGEDGTKQLVNPSAVLMRAADLINEGKLGKDAQ